MSIELLYIIPVIALSAFVFAISFFSMKHSPLNEQANKLASEVQQFNDGKIIPVIKDSEARITKFETAVDSVNKVLTNQQKIIEKFNEGNNAYNVEINSLKKQLNDLHREYDILVSENYALRAKVKKSESGNTAGITKSFPAVTDRKSGSFISSNTTHSKHGYSVNMSLCEDTKLFNVNSLDETKEFDVSELN